MMWVDLICFHCKHVIIEKHSFLENDIFYKKLALSVLLSFFLKNSDFVFSANTVKYNRILYLKMRKP